MTTETLEPTVRLRARARPVVAAPAEVPATPEAAAPVEALSNSEGIEAQAREMALDIIRTNAEANAASARARKLLKELGALCAQHELPTFEVSFEGKTYDAGEVAEKVDEVDIELLSKEITHEEFLKLVKTSQTDVKNHGGQTLLNRVLKAVTKPSEFKVKKRKD